MTTENSFSLDVLAYEFPLASDKYDANWLQVRIRAQTDSSSWTASSACLLTWELVRLRHWFSVLTTGVGATISFIENELAFRFDRESGKLVVVLDYALHPNESSYRYDVDTECLLELDWNELRRQEILTSLDALISRFPERVVLA
ncbi:WapI family immunity protein [Roseateles chitinivorans]|uniref:WapI family immunity protein n=1 Tax=Roseateles chitinivorans TaxID=2917965 RepID=UPI003D66E20F